MRRSERNNTLGKYGCAARDLKQPYQNQERPADVVDPPRRPVQFGGERGQDLAMAAGVLEQVAQPPAARQAGAG
jgi:hypothetical protein